MPLKKESRMTKGKLRTILKYVLGAPALIWAAISITIVIVILAVLSIPLAIFEFIFEQNS
jgi:hypothetical protein